MVPFEEPRAIFYYPPANQLWVYTGFLEKIYTYELDTWEQDSIVAPIGEGEGEEIHGTFFKNDTLLVSNYSGVIWYIPTVITNDTLPEAVYINEMPQNVMDLVELKLIGSREERGLCPNLEAPDTLYALYASKSYQWYRDGETLENDTLDRVAMDTEGEYQLLTEIDSSGNMIFSEVITVSHATVPTVTITASATALCPGDEITLTGSAGGSSQWYRNGEAIEGATSNVYVATETGWYNMIKTNQSGCSDSAAVGIAIVAEDPLVCNPEATVTKSVESGIKIYPTVTDGIIWIENNSGTEVMVSVFTITGNQVANVRSAGEQKISADLTSCADGLYIVQLMAGDMVRTQRIIKE